MSNKKDKKPKLPPHGIPCEPGEGGLPWQTEICGARAKSTGLPCKRIPMANGRCQVHGGRTATGEAKERQKHKGNKHAVTHGAYETIWFDTLSEVERGLVANIQTDIEKQLDDELKLLAIRERRMMLRIQIAHEEHDDYIARAVDIVYGKEGKPDDDNVETDDYGNVIRRPINTTEYMENKVDFIQRIEMELTKIADKKHKLLDLKHKLQQAKGDTGNVDLSVYITALEQSSKDIWDDELLEEDSNG